MDDRTAIELMALTKEVSQLKGFAADARKAAAQTDDHLKREEWLTSAGQLEDDATALQRRVDILRKR
jgi:hypothetical protein